MPHPPELLAHLTAPDQPGPMVIEEVEVYDSHVRVNWRAEAVRTPWRAEPGNGIKHTPIVLSNARGTEYQHHDGHASFAKDRTAGWARYVPGPPVGAALTVAVGDKTF